MCITQLCAQQIHFNRNYPFQNVNVITGSVVQKPDSGFVFVSAVTQSATDGYIFTETDKYGDTLFARRYTYQDTVFYLGYTNSLLMANDGNYVQCGYVRDTALNVDGVVIKFNSNGDTLWMKTRGGSGYDAAQSIYEDVNGNYWICGSTNSSGNGQFDFWLLILDPNGNVQLDTTYGTYLSEHSQCGHFTYDGGFILSGDRGGVPYIVKLSNAGNVEWTQTFNFHSGYGYTTQLPDSSYVMVCRPTTITDLAILFLDSVGGITSSAYVGFPQYTEVPCAKPIVCADGIAVAGNTGSVTLGCLVKTDFSGNLLWKRYYNTYTSPQTFIDFQQTSDGGFILAGLSNPSPWNAWLVKVDSLGCEVAGCDGVGIPVQHSEETINLFPNPAADVVNFHFSERDDDRVLIIYDQLGREVWRDESNAEFISVDASGFAEGLYSYCAIHGDAINTRGKFVIAR